MFVLLLVIVTLELLVCCVDDVWELRRPNQHYTSLSNKFYLNRMKKMPLRIGFVFDGC